MEGDGRRERWREGEIDGRSERRKGAGRDGGSERVKAQSYTREDMAVGR